MNRKEERKQFIQNRLVRPFGRIVAWIVEIVQLKNPDSYVQNSAALQEALRTLQKRTAETVFAGEMVSEDSKAEVSEALACCLIAHPALPFRSLAQNQLAGAIRNHWAAYERVAGQLTACRSASESLLGPLARHMTIEMAVRAGAIAWLSGNQTANEPVPIWSSDEDLKVYLRCLLREIFQTRESAADALRRAGGGASPSDTEVDRWLDSLDIPSPHHIRNWDAALSTTKGVGANHLFHLYVGRRLWNSMKSIAPVEMHRELLEAFWRIRCNVFSYLASVPASKVEETRQVALTLLVNARIADPLLGQELLRGHSDVLWRRHVEAIVQVLSMPTAGLTELCQTWAAIADLHRQIPALNRPKNLDDFARVYFEKAEKGGTPSAEYARLAESAIRYQSNGDFQKAEACAMQLLILAPTAAGPWDILGTIRMFQNRRDEAVDCYRTAVHLEPASMETRGKLVTALSERGRDADAEAALFDCEPRQRELPEWLFAHGVLLVRRQCYAEAKQEFIKCIGRKFLLPTCYQFLALTSGALGEVHEQREYEKRARELAGG